MESQELQNKILQITSIALVERGNESNKWKELEVKIKNWEKGSNYSIPLKKKSGEETVAYQMYKANRDEWEGKFIDDKTVELDASYSEKVNNWEFEGQKGQTTYRTIRFLKPVEGLGLDAVNNMAEPKVESDLIRETPAPVEDEIDVDSLPFNN